MLRAFTGFVVIGVLVAAGYLVARTRLVPVDGGRVLNWVAFFVASPALLFTVVARADVHVLFSSFVLVAAVDAVGTAALFVTASRVWFRGSSVDTALGAVLTLTGRRLPDVLAAPPDVLGGAAVPMMPRCG